MSAAFNRRRAPIGGVIASNGDFYEGGKFLPSTDRPKGIAHGARKPRRDLIEPGVFADVPEGQRPIFAVVRAVVRFDGDRMVIPSQCEKSAAYYYGSIAAAQTLVDRYNAGERWIEAQS